ncbi:MAG TPA: dTDP-glucose 4,6-dehydratase [Gammaproteobacteria bacterium]|nr:dTDP-glucose 4,6-dehydratase [Gammaproteobacteria bacterium]
MRKLLVTGGAGFIGTNFVHYWVKQHPQNPIVVLDALTYAGNPANLDPIKSHPTYRFVLGNICDDSLLNTLFEEQQFDTIVHFAAESHVDRSITGPDAFIETNVVGTHVLLKAAKRAWLDNKAWSGASRFHHVSTDEVYGSLHMDDPAFTEATPYDPSSPYSASKAASDHLVRAYHRTYGLPVTLSNCSNNYGPYQYPEKLIPVVITNALAGRPIPVYGDGNNVRDWLFVEDHCHAIERILQDGVIGETYNIGGESEINNLDLVGRICEILDKMRPTARPGGYKSLIKFVNDRPGHDRRYAMNITKINIQLGWNPRVTLDVGLQRTVTWYLNKG